MRLLVEFMIIHIDDNNLTISLESQSKTTVHAQKGLAPY